MKKMDDEDPRGRDALDIVVRREARPDLDVQDSIVLANVKAV